MALTFGSQFVYLNATAALQNSTCGLSSTKFVVAYRDSSDDSHTTARVATVSGSDVTFGPETEAFAASSAYVHAVTLDSSTVAIAYRDAAAGRYRVKIGTVAGTDITFGPERTATTTDPRSIHLVALDSTHFIALYQLNGNVGLYAISAVVTGTDITFGTAKTIRGSGELGLVSGCALDSTHAAVTFNMFTGSGWALVLTVAGLDITLGAEHRFTVNMAVGTGSLGLQSSAALDSAHFVVCWTDEDDADAGKAVVAAVSGTDITYGGAVEFVSACGWPVILNVDSSTFVVCYRDESDSNHGTARVGHVSGTTISFGDAVEFLSADGTDHMIAYGMLPGTSKFAIAFKDSSVIGHGKVVVGTISGAGALMLLAPPNKRGNKINLRGGKQ